MNTARKVCLADQEGIVHLDVAVGAPGRSVEVLVVWDQAEPPQDSESEDWSDLYGILAETPLDRGEQGQIEERDALE